MVGKIQCKIFKNFSENIAHVKQNKPKLHKKTVQDQKDIFKKYSVLFYLP